MVGPWSRPDKRQGSKIRLPQLKQIKKGNEQYVEKFGAQKKEAAGNEEGDDPLKALLIPEIMPKSYMKQREFM